MSDGLTLLDGIRAATHTAGPSFPSHTFDGVEEVDKTQKVADVAFTSQYPGLSNYITSILNLPRCYKVLSNHKLYDRETKNEAGVRFIQSLIGMTTAFLNTVNIVRILATDGLCLKLFTFTPLFIILSIPIVLIEIAICIFYLKNQAEFGKDPLFELQNILTKPHYLLTEEDMDRLIVYIDEHAEFFQKTLTDFYFERNIDEEVQFSGTDEVYQLVDKINSLREKLIYLKKGYEQLEPDYRVNDPAGYNENINGIKLRFQLISQQLLLESFRKTHLEVSEEEIPKNKGFRPQYTAFDAPSEEHIERATQKKLTLAKRIYSGLRDFLAKESLTSRVTPKAMAETAVIEARVNEVRKNLLEINAKRKAKHILLIVKIVAMSLVFITTILALTGCPVAYLPLALLLIAYGIDIFHWFIEKKLSTCMENKMRKKQAKQEKEALQVSHEAPLYSLQPITLDPNTVHT